MSVLGGHAAAGAATGSLVPDAAAAPAETIPIMTLPTETAVPFDWQSSPWEATNPPGRDDAGRVDWTKEWVDFTWKSQAKVWQESHARDASLSNKAWTQSPQSPFSLWGQSKTPPVPTVPQPEPEAPAVPVPTVHQFR